MESNDNYPNLWYTKTNPQAIHSQRSRSITTPGTSLAGVLEVSKTNVLRRRQFEVLEFDEDADKIKYDSFISAKEYNQPLIETRPPSAARFRHRWYEKQSESEYYQNLLKDKECPIRENSPPPFIWLRPPPDMKSEISRSIITPSKPPEDTHGYDILKRWVESGFSVPKPYICGKFPPTKATQTKLKTLPPAVHGDTKRMISLSLPRAEPSIPSVESAASYDRNKKRESMVRFQLPKVRRISRKSGEQYSRQTSDSSLR